MYNPQRRYWAIRTDKYNKSLLFGELCKGRIRQGWGHDPSQDLRLIYAVIEQGGTWWDRLSNAQKEVLPQLRMLSKSEDSIKVGDLILLPNLPDEGRFCIAEVTGEYYYEPLVLIGDQDINALGKDYGHVLPALLITDQGIDKYADRVHASLRSTLRTPMRMWNLDSYAEVIERLLDDYKAGVDLTTSTSGEARLEKAWETALFHAADALREKLTLELDARFQAAEWEEPIKLVLNNLYPGAQVRWVAGSQEYGADVVVQIPNHFSGPPWLILVQVKNYRGEIGSAVLEQLKTAYERYNKEGKVLSVIVMTTAMKASSDLVEGATRLEEELKIPVKVILQKEMIKILSDGLTKRLTISEPI